MFHKVGIPTIAVVENMNGLLAGEQMAQQLDALVDKHSLSEDAAADLRHLVLETPQRIFGESHVTQLKEMWGIQSSFSLPLLDKLAASADGGVPFVLSHPNSEASEVYRELASAVVNEAIAITTKELP